MMKTPLAIVGCLILTAGSMLAQNNSAASKTNGAPATASGTNAAPATSETTTNEVTIDDLIKLPAFTNKTGMIMVKISDGLWAGRYEVTQDEYSKVAGSNPSKFSGPQNPVDSVSWNDAVAFCAKLTEAEVKDKWVPDGMAYTLPTQAQWQGFAAGVDLKDAITGSGTTRSGTSPVGTLNASAQGLYDVRGNVWEWCLDPQDQAYRVARGGAWNEFIEVNLRPEFRYYGKGPDDRKDNIGFRVVLTGK